jgi:simple sugar transport system substrate-binding protein
MMEETVKKRTLFLLLTVLLAFSIVAGPAVAKEPAQDDKELVFYWISHGAEGDPIWIFAMDGATKAGEALGVTVRASFHHQDLTSQKEAFMAAIAAGADGIATSSPEVGTMNEEVKLAHEKGIPVVFFNTDDPGSGRDAYVGGDMIQIGRAWASYLVDNKLVKAGDTVWMPVEVPGATYGSEETKGIAPVLEAAGVKYEVFDAKYDPIQTLDNMVDYLTANGDKINAMIGLGDMVTGFTQKAFERVGWEAGHIPVVGWGNSYDTATAVKAGYVNAATWQFPDAQGYMPIYMLYEAATGHAVNYQVLTFGMYTKDNADTFIGLTEKLQSK